jgi:quercetin dioxygenase-like cupin family protein
MAMKGNCNQQKKGTKMNPLIHFKKILILPVLIALAFVVVPSALATLGCGITVQDLAVGHFPSGSLDLRCNDQQLNWKLKTKVKGDTDVYITQYRFLPGGHTGWHTHPGPSLVTVISGELTVYEGDDPTCTPTIYGAGETFTDVGCGDVHLARNAGNVDTVLMVVHILPAGQPRRIDAPDPGNCLPFICP